MQALSSLRGCHSKCSSVRSCVRVLGRCKRGEVAEAGLQVVEVMIARLERLTLAARRHGLISYHLGWRDEAHGGSQEASDDGIVFLVYTRL